MMDRGGRPSGGGQEDDSDHANRRTETARDGCSASASAVRCTRRCTFLSVRSGDEHDGSEPDVDDEDGGDKEPSFGWNDEETAGGRSVNAMGISLDLEADIAPV